jgi:SM-20-related protein
MSQDSQGQGKPSDGDGRIQVLDGLYSDTFVKEVQNALIHSGWTYTEGAHPGADLVHWVTELSLAEPWVDAVHSAFRPALDKSGSYLLQRTYCNAHVCSDAPLPHADSLNSHDRTVLFYANAAWQPEFAGETIFLDDDDEIFRSILPRPGRVIIFDSNIRHCARPPTKIFLGIRLTVAFKFQATTSSAG